MLTEAVHHTEARVAIGINVAWVCYRLPTDESGLSRSRYIAKKFGKVRTRQGPFHGSEGFPVQQKSDISRILRKA